ncbi:uncharacterized protein N7477_007158 [Penicillium maclennaniae]|uniref:uncharacterized protein n=1 Tax=Penicillium maclennaniae TaxID=1343394 RepID=UPI002541601E|nr:uncharacterized protein N7477_007158 [Penicillium maclennaniae]KAJ5668588.1 hypothetical protein N7477_007158 [Penicillium maclennaniae]
MNWTGGQLHRSARQGALSKIQLQNFAKSRQVALGRSSRHLSPFPGCPEFPSTGDCGRAAGKEIQDVATDGRSQKQASPPPRLPAVSIKSGSHLDSVKRQLLLDPDWATVSAARPLEIAFTSAEEIEQFGKRRKLNDHDRQRLSAAESYHALSGSTRLCRSGREIHPREVRPDQIDIWIDGRPAGLHASSQRQSTNVPSSQSMLLDHETYPSARKSERSPPEYTRLVKSSQPIHRKFLDGSDRTPACAMTEPLDKTISGAPHKERFLTSSSNPSERNFNRMEPKMQHQSTTDQLLQARHFTFDDQALAERRGQVTALGHRALSCSPTTTLVASPAPSNPQFLSPRETFSWLPCPRHVNDLSSPNSGRLHTSSLRESIADRSPYPNSPAHIFRDVPTCNSPRNPSGYLDSSSMFVMTPWSRLYERRSMYGRFRR